MAVLEVAKLGNPILRQIAEPVRPEESNDPGFQRCIDDMVETMRKLDGVGLAAPQVSWSKQIIVLASNHNPRYPAAPELPLMVLLNPKLVFQSEETIEGWEACLSVKDLRGKVRRHAAVRVEAFDREMRLVAFEAEAFLAVVLQHEIDHLNGKVFLDRMTDFSTLTHMDEFDRFWLSDTARV
ncbi:MAG: peptide deformylase [Nitrospiria bacterium]